MASTENPDPETGKSEPIPASATTPPPSAASFLDCRKIDVIIRVLLFSATLTALIVMVTSDQCRPGGQATQATAWGTTFFFLRFSFFGKRAQF
ncbi:hypothetical protein ARALYDRAFT_921102 [Arabidopsis lyrata subsp. lyrata]|uniref:CASP-like protein n=1 Tax=Arabidopsis lyrata subsp. lyrata TaxID=81972 RepID=D7MYD4_ARALL|nr:hypothetical protein ARALYDRAFT_921102 [Arabidopsis lyrata subsp. lyrata]